MNEALFEQIGAFALEIANAKSDLRDRFKKFEDKEGNQFPSAVPIPGADYSVNEIISGLSGLETFLNGLEIKDSGPLVPRSLLQTLTTKLDELKNAIGAVNSLFSTIDANGGVRKFERENFTATAPNDTQHQFAKVLRQLFNALDAALCAWYQVRYIARSPRITDFAKYVKELEAQRDTLQELFDGAAKLVRGINEKDDAAIKTADNIAEMQTQIARAAQESNSSRQVLSEYSSEATNKLTEIRSTSERAASLTASLSDYQANFDSFDAELKARTKLFETQKSDFESVKNRLLSEEKEIKRLIAESEGLLRGATNVGLAASFSGLQSKIGNELKWAEAGFYVSIAVLIFLSLPIAMYVFPGLQGLLKVLIPSAPDIIVSKIVEQHNTPDILAQVAARALLLIPGIWLVRFAGARHERLFRLREHYAYKYSIASSVEGFKKQAPEMEQAIAATAFYELTFNPATRMDSTSTEARYPNPAMEWVMKKLGSKSEQPQG